jgi:hypothetical protein
MEAVLSKSGQFFYFVKEIKKILHGKMANIRSFERRKGFLSGSTGVLSEA